MALPRTYYERAIIFGLRAIFQYNPAHRWPARPCLDDQDDSRAAGCHMCRDATEFEGVQFVDEDAAGACDLDRLHVAADNGTRQAFATWEDAERWLRGDG